MDILYIYNYMHGYIIIHTQYFFMRAIYKFLEKSVFGNHDPLCRQQRAKGVAF